MWVIRMKGRERRGRARTGREGKDEGITRTDEPHVAKGYTRLKNKKMNKTKKREKAKTSKETGTCKNQEERG